MTTDDRVDLTPDPQDNLAGIDQTQFAQASQASESLSSAPQSPATYQQQPQQPQPPVAYQGYACQQSTTPMPQAPAQQQYQQYQQYHQPWQPQQQATYQQPYASTQPAHQAARPAQADKPAKKDRPLAKTFVAGFLGALIACGLFMGISSAFDKGPDSSGSSSDSPASVVLGSQNSTEIESNADEDATLAEKVANKALPSVAAIDVYTSTGSMYGFMPDSSTLTETSLGSGVVLSEDGYIITNYHVIEGAEALKVTVGGEEYEANIVGTDESSDLAVIKVQGATGLVPIELGDSDSLNVGEWVMTIGSPFGLEQSVATGIVSATSRSQIYESTDDYGMSTGETTIYANMIQTDAAINPGNSGGALVDADGKLIGINTLITSYSGNYSGVGFAIPVNYAINIAQQIIAGETPTHAQLGVSLSTIDSSIASRYGFSVDYGAYISTIYEGSGAADADLQEGDIVIAADGKKIESASDLMLAIRGKNPGDSMELTVNRNGEELQVAVTLGSELNK